MVMSIDVDTYLKNDPERTGELVEALGQGSAFEDAFGYYLDPVSPSLPSFPGGWQDRLLLLGFGDVKAFLSIPTMWRSPNTCVVKIGTCAGCVLA